MRWVAAMVLAACWRDAPPPREPVEEPAPPPPAMTYRHPPPPHLDRFDEFIERMRGFTDEMCQCSDSNCTNQVTGELMKWAQELGNDPELRERMQDTTEQQAKAMAEVTKQLTDCMMRAMAQPPPQP